jgi:hypothetical protein
MLRNVGQRAMVWSRKQRGPESGYYYRSRRVDGRPVKLYVGRGPDAELAARLDERERQDRRAEREAFLAERVRLAAADLAFADARALVDLLVRATLALGGFHTHHGQWRRRRGRATYAG